MKLIKIYLIFTLVLSLSSKVLSDVTSECDKYERGKKYDCLIKLKRESIKAGTKETTKKIKKQLKQTKKSIKEYNKKYKKQYDKINKKKTLFDLFKKASD